MRTRRHIALLFICTAIALSTQAHEVRAVGPNSIGVTQGEGLHFQIPDSDYLNISLESTEVIKLRMESVPNIIMMRIKSAFASATSTQVTITGFLPHTTYYKYEDNYHNLAEILSDENGAYSYTQDISKPHLIFIQPRKSTKFITNDATGGDCASIGTWNPATITCTLTTDVTETIQVDSNGITLDGGGHTMRGAHTGSGVYLDTKTGVTVKNLIIEDFSYRIILSDSNNSIFAGNRIAANRDTDQGILLFSSHNNTFIQNTFSDMDEELTLYDSNDNNIHDNDFSRANEALTLYNSNDNVIYHNTFSDAYEALTLYDSSENKIYNNNFINNDTHVTDYDGINNTFNLAEPEGGNYFNTFDEHAEGCDDANLDNFCDASYAVDYVGGRDNLPWTKQDGWEISLAPRVSNVLFLPGIEGSRLYNGNSKLWEPHGDALAAKLAMDASGASVEGGVYVKKDDILDNAYLPIKGNVYKSFIEEMNDMVSVGTMSDWEAVPYDWRLSPDQILSSGAEVAPGKISYLTATSSPYIIQELRRLAASSKTHKVTIIAHSNGGLITKRLTELLGSQAPKLIDQIIFVAVPQVGTPKAIGAILHGFDQSLPVKMLSRLGLSDAMARTLARNMPGIYNMLPSANYFTQVDDSVITFSNDPLLAPWRAAYGDVIHSTERLRAFLADQTRTTLPVTDPLISPIIANSSLLQQAETLHTSLDTWSPPTGISLTEIAGWGEETLKTISYYQGVGSICTQNRPDSTCAAMISQPVLQYRPVTTIDGDGTVVVPSALWTANSTRYWVDLKEYGKSNLGTKINRQHGDVLEVPSLRTFIQNIITHSATSTLPEFITTSAPLESDPEKRLHFTLHSPLDLNLYDDEGNHTGFSTTTNSLEENIPGSRYIAFGEVQYVSVPADQSVHLVLNGYASGSFTLDLAEVQGDTILATTTFAGVPSATNTVASLSVPANVGIAGASPLVVDENGDGRTDLVLTPQIGVVVVPVLDTVPPEAVISFATSTNDLVITGRDEGGGVTVGPTSVMSRDILSYVITDGAHNTATILFKKIRDNSHGKITASFSKITYNPSYAGGETPIPENALEYSWELDKKGLLVKLNQKMKVRKGFEVRAVYDAKKGETQIFVKNGISPEKLKEVKRGLVLLRVITNEGKLDFEY